MKNEHPMNPTNSESDNAPPIEEEIPVEEPTKRDFTESVEDAFKTGAEDAKEAFEKAIPKAKEDIAKGVHDLAYAVSYAAIFGTELLKEITPENILDGLRDGSNAGRKAAEEVVRERKEKAERDKGSNEHGGDSIDDAEPVIV